MDFGWLDIRCCINYGFAYLLLGVSLAERARTKGYISFVNNMTDFPNNFFGSNFSCLSLLRLTTAKFL